MSMWTVDAPDWSSDGLTNGQCYGPAMEITDRGEAMRYFAALVAYGMRQSGRTVEEQIKTELANIGYYSGYYGIETQQRVQEVFATVHPVFGAVDSPDSPRRMGTAPEDI